MNYESPRNRMVDEQLIPRGITDPAILDVFRKTERHEFVSSAMRKSAYEDCPLPIGEGQTISQPYIVALMTQCLSLSGREKVLEIGTGSGYQAAILAGLAREVYSVERIKILADRALDVLSRLGYGNVKIKVDDGTLGWEEHAPYDRIIVTAASPKIPDFCKEQLAPGGKVVIPVGSMFGQVLTIAEKAGKDFRTGEVCGCVFVPLIGKDGWREKC